MYIEGNFIYSDAYNYLSSGNVSGFKFRSDIKVEEFKLDLSSGKVEDGLLIFNDGKLVFPINYNWSYADYKRYFIKLRYSNDDQIAIILNKDESEGGQLKFNRMEDWRKFATDLSKLMISIK